MIHLAVEVNKRLTLDVKVVEEDLTTNVYITIGDTLIASYPGRTKYADRAIENIERAIAEGARGFFDKHLAGW